MHISEIGKKTGLEGRKVGRVLRLLATNHVFREGACLYTLFYFLETDLCPSVGKRFHKQSVEHPTPFNQPIVQSRASLVGFIYFEERNFLTI